MASNNSEQLNIRVTDSGLFISQYDYDSKGGKFNIKKYFFVNYRINFAGAFNPKECAEVLKKEFAKNNIKNKKIIFTIMSNETSIMNFDIIKQKNYIENVKVLTAMAKSSDSVIDSKDVTTAYIPTGEYMQKIDRSKMEDDDTDKKRNKGKKKDEVKYMKCITYVTPADVMKVLKQLCDELGKELDYIDTGVNSVYNYFKKYVMQKNDSCLLIHISDGYTVISTILNGSIVGQRMDNFSYSGIMTLLALYKTCLKSQLNTIDATIDAINSMYLYNITQEDLMNVQSLNLAEKNQLLEAQSVLTDYTVDFIDRIKAVIDYEIRNNNNRVNRIYIYNDNVKFPDLTYTVSSSLNVNSMNIGVMPNVVKGANKLMNLSYLVSGIGTSIEPLNLDVNHVAKKNGDKIQKYVFYSLVFSTFFISLGIIFYFMFSFMSESKKNTELIAKIAEAEEAQKVYMNHTEIETAYNTLKSFKNEANDLDTFSTQMSAISDVMPKKGITIENVSANAGEGASQGTLSMSVTASSKDVLSKFILGLESIEYFTKVENNSASDSGGKGKDRSVTGSIVCYYALHEEEPEPAPEAPAETTDTGDSDDAQPVDGSQDLVLPD